MTTIDPVIDPTSDYDIFDPQYLLDPFPTIEQIRQSRDRSRCAGQVRT